MRPAPRFRITAAFPWKEKRMKKKLTALLAAFLMVVSALPISAFALAFNQRSTKLDGDCTLPDIQIAVTVPTGMNAYVNPKGVPVEVGGQVTRKKIVCDTAYIENESTAPVAVSAKITGKVNTGSNLVLAEQSTASSGATDKRAFIYFEMHAVNSATKKAWDTEYDPEKHILVTTGTEEKENFVVIGAASQKNHFGTFRLTGDCVASPVDDPGTEDDGFTATIVFTFEAVPYTTT
jgi:hypothetical protein